jgi:glycerophosphoryl diester phosphodiesterase
MKSIIACFLAIFLLLQFDSYCCDSTTIIAHRGVSSIAPQNTLPAFQLGIDLNVDFIELDVQKSSDDSLMVIHDPTVNATTSYSGLVSSYTYNELKQMDAGSWFSSDFVGVEIPTLHEVLTLAQGKIKVCVELKASNIESQAMQMIESMGMLNDVVIFSFSLSQLQIVKNINPNVKVCYLSSLMTSGDITDALSIDAEYLGVGQDPSVENINAAKDAGLQIWNYTVNDARSMLNKMSKGMSGIITDNAQDMIGLKSYLRNGGLIAQWAFNENSGTTSTDDSFNGNDLNVTNTNWITGVSQSAIRFNGISDYVTVPTTPSLNIDLDAVSLSVWVKLEELPSQISGSYGPIYDSDDDYYVLYLDKGNEELRFKVKDNNGLTSRPGIPQSALTLNEWIHIVGVYNGKEAMIYLNGELMDSHTTTGIGNLGQNQSAQLGRDNGNYFKGGIDEFRIYERPLTQQEVIKHYELDFSACGFSENFEYALSSISNVFEDTSACSPVEISMSYELPRNIYEFDGMDYVNIESIIDDIQYNSHSFFAWIKTENTTSDERVFAVNDRYGGNRFLFGMYDGKVDLYVPGSHLLGTSLVNDNEWHYIGYTWNIITNSLSIYVDGVEEQVYSEDLAVSSTDRASIGQEFDGFQTSNYYNGKLAEISIWKKAVPAGDIAFQMMSPIAESSTDLVGLFKRPIQCAYSLEDASPYQNHGVMCRPLFSELEYLPSYSSTDYVITWTDASGNILSSGPQLNSSFENSTSIYYQALNGNINILDTIEIEAYPLPDLDLGNDTLICSAADLVLDAGVQNSYLWSDNSTQQTLAPDFSAVGSFTFSVSVENQFGCTSEDDINIEVQDCAELSILNSEDIIFYPNPFRDVVYANVNLEEYEIAVYDAFGRRKEITQLNNHAFRLDGKNTVYYIKQNNIIYPLFSIE